MLTWFSRVSIGKHYLILQETRVIQLQVKPRSSVMCLRVGSRFKRFILITRFRTKSKFLLVIALTLRLSSFARMSLSAGHSHRGYGSLPAPAPPGFVTTKGMPITPPMPMQGITSTVGPPSLNLRRTTSLGGPHVRCSLHRNRRTFAYRVP